QRLIILQCLERGTLGVPHVLHVRFTYRNPSYGYSAPSASTFARVTRPGDVVEALTNARKVKFTCTNGKNRWKLDRRLFGMSGAPSCRNTRNPARTVKW